MFNCPRVADIISVEHHDSSAVRLRIGGRGSTMSRRVAAIYTLKANSEIHQKIMKHPEWKMENPWKSYGPIKKLDVFLGYLYCRKLCKDSSFRWEWHSSIFTRVGGNDLTKKLGCNYTNWLGEGRPCRWNSQAFLAARHQEAVHFYPGCTSPTSDRMSCAG